MKKKLYSIYSLNLSRSSNLLNVFGFSNKNSKNFFYDDFFITKDYDYFFIKNIENQDFLRKKIKNVLQKKLENGSYHGYKFYRTLPIKNQRTKTNSKTTRYLNKK